LRYTKELQANVCDDIKYGLTPQQCSEKYNIPISVIIKWNNLEMPAQRAAEIALRKYQVEVSDTEAIITDRLCDVLDTNVSDEEYFKLCDSISKTLYKLVADVVTKERQLNPHDEPKSDAEIIIEITNKWKDNKFLKVFSLKDAVFSN
jgi:hypothetical protein